MNPKSIDRFWSKVNQGDGCWEWAAAKNPATGYGVIRIDSRLHYAHRLSYELHHGPIPDGQLIDHRCHNRGCVNPGHLRLADYSQNNENRPYVNRTGYRGVTRNRCGRGRPINTWTATVQKGGKQWRATFTSPEAAAEAARLKRLEWFTHNNQDREAA